MKLKEVNKRLMSNKRFLTKIENIKGYIYKYLAVTLIVNNVEIYNVNSVEISDTTLPFN
jgi:hypothetical protein